VAADSLGHSLFSRHLMTNAAEFSASWPLARQRGRGVVLKNTLAPCIKYCCSVEFSRIVQYCFSTLYSGDGALHAISKCFSVIWSFLFIRWMVGLDGSAPACYHSTFGFE
jgi:hypothetical protein